MVMSADSEAYRRQLLQLLPPGRAWAQSAGSNLSRLMRGIGDGLARIDAAIHGLMDEADPRTTLQLLPDWEYAAGLPDPCVTVPQTVSQRRTVLQTRLTATGGANADYFIGLAATLGYTATVDEPSTFVWRLNIAESTGISTFRAGQAVAGDPLRAWGNEPLECLINRVKPAHTRALFAYGVTTSASN